jgi:hypothetical protein
MVEVLGERLPGPGDPLTERLSGNVLDTLHELDEEGSGVRVDRGEPNPAVTHQHGRHPMGRRGLEHGVPHGLRVVVGVRVDEAGCDGQPGVLAEVGADRRDLAVPHGDVSVEGPSAGPVDDGPSSYQQIEHAGSWLADRPPVRSSPTGCARAGALRG